MITGYRYFVIYKVHGFCGILPAAKTRCYVGLSLVGMAARAARAARAEQYSGSQVYGNSNKVLTLTRQD